MCGDFAGLFSGGVECELSLSLCDLACRDLKKFSLGLFYLIGENTVSILTEGFLIKE